MVVSHAVGLRYRLYPTPEQQSLWVRTFGCVRWVVNRMIEERSRRWREERKSMSYKQMSALLTEWKKQPEFAWLGEVSCVPLQQALRHLDKAYRRFFEWCRERKGRKAGYPNFLRKIGRQSAEFTSSALSWNGKDLRLAKCKQPLDLVWTQIFWGDPSTVTVSLEPDGTWWTSLRVEMEVSEIDGGRDAVGIDLGLTDYLVDDLGNRTKPAQPLKKALAKLAKEQKRLERKKKGGKNREKARRKVARLHAKVRRIRLDFLHKLSSKLIAENQVICVETLKSAGMMKNRRLARSIADAAWNEFVRQLQYKAAWRDRTVVRISQWEPSSKKCSCCGHRLKELDLKVRMWTCPSCSAVHDRDVNAAINIRVAGLAILAERSNACGADVRRGGHTVAAQSARKQEGPQRAALAA